MPTHAPSRDAVTAAFRAALREWSQPPGDLPAALGPTTTDHEACFRLLNALTSSKRRPLCVPPHGLHPLVLPLLLLP